MRFGFRRLAKRFVKSTKAATITQKIIGLAVGLFVAAALLPVAITNLFAANTTTWDTASQTMWTVIPLMGMIAVVLVLVGVYMRGRG